EVEWGIPLQEKLHMLQDELRLRPCRCSLHRWTHGDTWCHHPEVTTRGQGAADCPPD
ncbi:Hypothetical protein SMAX5B_015299, partial [Scophthalmus maximus]